MHIFFLLFLIFDLFSHISIWKYYKTFLITVLLCHLSLIYYTYAFLITKIVHSKWRVRISMSKSHIHARLITNPNQPKLFITYLRSWAWAALSYYLLSTWPPRHQPHPDFNSALRSFILEKSVSRTLQMVRWLQNIECYRLLSKYNRYC